jgi:hypothetical protein
VKSTNHLHRIPKLRIREAIPLVFYTFSWRGAELSTGTTLLSKAKPIILYEKLKLKFTRCIKGKNKIRNEFYLLETPLNFDVSEENIASIFTVHE